MALPHSHRLPGSAGITAKLRFAKVYRRGPFVLRMVPADGSWRIAVAIPARVIGKATQRNALRRALTGIIEQLPLRAGWHGTLSVQRWSADVAPQASEMIRALCIESGILNQ